MTNKRMFSADIVASDFFLDMPPSTQALYFQLGMHADDRGFVQPKKVMRILGSSDNELHLLTGKRFVIPFEDGVLLIKHWRMNNNKIDGDRFKETVYTEHLGRVFIKENRAYTLDKSQGQSVCAHSVPALGTQKRREEKRIEEKRETAAKPHSSIEYLRKMPEEEVKELSTKYRLHPKGIIHKATDLVLYCEAKGRQYKNYKSFLENALRGDHGLLRERFGRPDAALVSSEPEKPLTDEQKKRAQNIKDKISMMVKGKTI